jgi:hypothetical protein
MSSQVCGTRWRRAPSRSLTRPVCRRTHLRARQRRAGGGPLTSAAARPRAHCATAALAGAAPASKQGTKPVADILGTGAPTAALAKAGRTPSRGAFAWRRASLRVPNGRARPADALEAFLGPAPAAPPAVLLGARALSVRALDELPTRRRSTRWVCRKWTRCARRLGALAARASRAPSRERRWTRSAP